MIDAETHRTTSAAIGPEIINANTAINDIPTIVTIKIAKY
jgi:hypothetical protein